MPDSRPALLKFSYTLFHFLGLRLELTEVLLKPGYDLLLGWKVARTTRWEAAAGMVPPNAGSVMGMLPAARSTG